MNKIKTDKIIIVEGKYDKIKLSSIVDAHIITTDGFRIFKDKDKCNLIKILAERNGIIILTYSDSAGQMIRKHIEKIVPKNTVTSVYLPTILGKERSKTAPSAEGLLGVEGTDDAIILDALKRAGIIGEKCQKKGRKITKTDLFNLGVSGIDGSKEKRASLCKFLNLPETLPANSLIDVLYSLYGFDDFIFEVEKWKQE